MLKTSYKAVLKNVLYRINDDDIFALAAQLAYSLILAFFPFLIFLLTLVGYSKIEAEDVIIGLSKILPKEAFNLVERTITDLTVNKSIGLLSFGLIVALWTASSGFSAIIKGLNKAYDEKENRSYIKVSILCLFFALAVAVIIFLAVALFIFGEINGKILYKTFGLKNFIIIWNYLRYILSLVILTCIFMLLYKFTPSRRLRIKEVLPGSIFTTVAFIITSILFSFYVNNFGNYSRLYGSIGAVIMLMTWIYLLSLILLLGGELNASIVYEKKKQQQD